MEDAVRPSQDVYRGVYERGFRTWIALWQKEEEEAAAAVNGSLLMETGSIYSAFPNHPHFPSRLLLDKSLSNVVFASGRSTWATSASPADPGCELPPFQEQTTMQVAWNRQTEVVLRPDQGLVDKRLPAPLFSGEASHHFPVLFLAWAYILSARWAELIPGAQGPTYNQDTRASSPAPAGHRRDDGGGERSGPVPGRQKPDPVVVEVDNVDRDAAQWWAAVLSTETGTGTFHGWRASIRNDKGALLCLPWSIQVSCNTPFVVVVSAEQQQTRSCTTTRRTKTTTTTTPSQHTPAPYRTALRYLSEYCRLHAISHQSEAALAAALLIPVAKLDGERIELSCPKSRCEGAPSAAAVAAAAALSSHDDQPYLPWDTEEEEEEEDDDEEEHPQPLDRLLTLSCHPRGAKALLSSIFFQPDVDCNLCGAWLQGSFAFLDSDAAREPQVRLRTFVRRDPGLAFFWLGAFITGAEARCIQDARAGWWKTDLSSAAWAGAHPLPSADISRADECRLLYLAHGPTHAVPPLFPFAPFGRTALQDADLDVRPHTQCPALHRLVYAGFAWNCQGGRSVKQGAGGDDDDHDNDDAPLVPVKTSELSRVAEVEDAIAVDYSVLDREDGDEISEMVTRNIFCWLRGDDGYPVAERALRQHEWINDVDSEDDDDDDDDNDDDHGTGQGREDAPSVDDDDDIVLR
ncbi:hypothetical protein CTA2_6653 [Colletotrichum tanaceti]|uniref:Uncharacterized protein n=1 Tax=Colletotrichum tanaceti TaxID=1306861 RepID=A0A4U6X4N2_9PEZI|nr:hypothetical protein CTA2_6653 [Colletotrichum tanaceti]TKW49759.1 hypothetical protein CTA1_13193 [Colletotrichum tanaceti]